MQRWEYKVEYLGSVFASERELNSLGEKGWELVNIYREDGTWYAVLKRPI